MISMKLSAHKISVPLLFILLVASSLAVVSEASASSAGWVSQNYLNVVVNMQGAGGVYPSSGFYNYGSNLTARVYTNPGYVFDGWYLNGVYMGRLTTMPIMIDKDYTLIAQFSQRTSYLTITTSPEDSGTTVPAAGIWNYSAGTSPRIYAYPSTGCNFSGWYLDGTYMGSGSSILVDMSQDHQLSAYFSGTPTNVTVTPTPAPSPTATPVPTPAPGALTPTLSFYCVSSTSQSGFNVKLQGALAYNGSGLSGEGIAFAYSASGGATWHELTYLITGDDGNFSAVWMPSVSGNYMIRGSYPGDGLYRSVTTAFNLSIAPTASQNMFSVVSNSTLSSLVFDSTQNRLSFSVSGPTGTAGFVQACIPKTLVSSIADLTAYLDGQDVFYTAYSSGDVWVVTLHYHHSSHSIVFAINSATPTPTQSATAAPTQSSSSTTSTTTTNPTAKPTVKPTATPASTPTIPEIAPLVVLPVLVLMLGFAIFVRLKRKSITKPSL
jgi:uncharacterized repeat protein (TIGR02543 family)